MLRVGVRINIILAPNLVEGSTYSWLAGIGLLNVSFQCEKKESPLELSRCQGLSSAADVFVRQSAYEPPSQEASSMVSCADQSWRCAATKNPVLISLQNVQKHMTGAPSAGQHYSNANGVKYTFQEPLNVEIIKQKQLRQAHAWAPFQGCAVLLTSAAVTADQEGEDQLNTVMCVGAEKVEIVKDNIRESRSWTSVAQGLDDILDTSITWLGAFGYDFTDKRYMMLMLKQQEAHSTSLVWIEDGTNTVRYVNDSTGLSLSWVSVCVETVDTVQYMAALGVNVHNKVEVGFFKLAKTLSDNTDKIELLPEGESMQFTCVKCLPCEPWQYKKGCGGASAGTCHDCEECPELSQLRAGCGYFSAGVCKEKHELVRTPFCPVSDGVSDETDNQLKIYVNQASGLGAFSFEQVFGVQKEQADFVCSSPCDGVEYNSIQCDGPFACNVKTCTESLQAEGNMIPIRACPVVIEEGDDSNTRLSKRRASCVKCNECGHVQKELQIYKNWGLGCARECSKLQCNVDMLWDWTARKCSKCSDLHSIDLCNADDRRTLNLQSSRTVTGNWPLLYFPDCEGNSPSKKLESFTYGRCVSCDKNKSSCPGLDSYPGACVDGHAECRKCHRSGAQDFVRVQKDTWYNSLIPAWEPLHCQISACLPREGVHWTGVGQADRLCTTECLPADCKAHETEVPCRLPHQARCEKNFPLPGPTARVQTYFDGEVNLLNEDNGNKHTRFASFENTLIVLDDSQSTQEFQCVWNAHGIFDNQASPGGVSNVLWRAGRSDDAEYTLRGTQVCREWSVEPGEWMPVLPLQNTISTGDGDEDSSRRILVNTEAYVLSYRFDGNFGDAVLQNIKAGFTDQEHQPKATMLHGAHVGGAGRLFLMMILHEPKVLLAVRVPTDRAVHKARWLQSLLLSFAVVDLTDSSTEMGVTVRVSVTADNKYVSDLDDNFVLESFWVQDIQG